MKPWRPLRRRSEIAEPESACLVPSAHYCISMESRFRDLEERIAFMQRHLEQQDRVILEISRQVARLAEQVARLRKARFQAEGEAEQGPPADEKPPHW